MKKPLSSTILLFSVIALAAPWPSFAGPKPEIARGAAAAGVCLVRCVAPDRSVNIKHTSDMLIEQGPTVSIARVRGKLMRNLRQVVRGDCEAPSRPANILCSADGRKFGTTKVCGPHQVIKKTDVEARAALAVRYAALAPRFHRIAYGFGWRLRWSGLEGSTLKELVQEAVALALRMIPPELWGQLQGDQEGAETNLVGFFCEQQQVCGAAVGGGDSGRDDLCPPQATPTPNRTPTVINPFAPPTAEPTSQTAR